MWVSVGRCQGTRTGSKYVGVQTEVIHGRGRCRGGGERNVQWTEEYAECITSTTPTMVMAVSAMEDIVSARLRLET